MVTWSLRWDAALFRMVTWSLRWDAALFRKSTRSFRWDGALTWNITCSLKLEISLVCNITDSQLMSRSTMIHYSSLCRVGSHVTSKGPIMYKCIHQLSLMGVCPKSCNIYSTVLLTVVAIFNVFIVFITFIKKGQSVCGPVYRPGEGKLLWSKTRWRLS